jgi:hypothetical protein
MTAIGFCALCAASNKLYSKACFGCCANKSNSSKMNITGNDDLSPDFNSESK